MILWTFYHVLCNKVTGESGKCRLTGIANVNLNWGLALVINWELVVRWSQSVSAGSSTREDKSGAGRGMPLSGFSIHHGEQCGNLIPSGILQCVFFVWESFCSIF